MSSQTPKSIRIKEISLCDFQAFPGPDHTTINLLQDGRGKGLSLLLYGENGSGKSSLGRALRDLLGNVSRAPDSFDKSRHTFSDPPTSARSVMLTFDDPAQPPIIWKPEDASHTLHPLFEAMTKSRGWMDYRMLWKSIEFTIGNDFANIFDALAESLLQDCDIPTTNQKFGELWNRIKRIARKEPTTQRHADELHVIRADVVNFSEKLEMFLPLLQDRANEILENFSTFTRIQLKLERPVLYDSSRHYNKFSSGTVSLRVSFRDRPVTKLDGFLNEARITAIALSIFLGALAMSTPPQLAGGIFFPRLLVLDDVLISLDMAHRRPLLEVLNEHFSGWQVLLLTHDRAWYEMAKTQLTSGKWKYVEMFAVPFGPYEQPMVKSDVSHFERAKMFLRNGEVKAAAVHVRTQFEITLKLACKELSLKVVYVDDPRRWEANQFWDTLKAHWSNRSDLTKLKADVSHSLSWVLNPHSHSRPVDHIRREITEAVDAVSRLDDEVLKEITNRKAEMAQKASDAALKAAEKVPADLEYSI